MTVEDANNVLSLSQVQEHLLVMAIKVRYRCSFGLDDQTYLRHLNVSDHSVLPIAVELVQINAVSILLANESFSRRIGYNIEYDVGLFDMSNCLQTQLADATDP